MATGLPDLPPDVLRFVGQHLAFVNQLEAAWCLLTSCRTTLQTPAPTTGWRGGLYAGHPCRQSLLAVLGRLADLDAFALTCRGNHLLAWTAMSPPPKAALLLCRFGFAAAFLVALRGSSRGAFGVGAAPLWLAVLSRSEPALRAALSVVPAECLDACDAAGETALFKACLLDLRPQALTLLQARASPGGAEQGGGLTALNVACRRCDEPLVEALLSARADPLVLERTDAGTALCACVDAVFASERGRLDRVCRLDRLQERCQILRRLLAARASVQGACWRGASAAHTAAQTDPSACLLRLLLQASARSDARDDAGETPLHTAALYGHGHCVRALLDAGADADAQDLDGRTPRDVVLGLQLGCRGGELDRDLAQRLLSHLTSSSESETVDDETGSSSLEGGG
jgi:hypothetical protein